MLYVSKKYGVKDTSDGIEKVYSGDDLLSLVNNNKTVIRGVIRLSQ